MNRIDRCLCGLVSAAFLLLSALLGAGCSALGGAALDAQAGADPPEQILATLKPGNERIWPRVAEELAVFDGVRVRASWYMRSLGEQCLVLDVPAGRHADRVAQRIGSHARVSTASVSRRFRLLGGDDDPYAPLQEAVAPLRLAQAHRIATGRGVSVAVVDTGLELAHPDLVGRVRRAHDFVGRERGPFTAELHGTAVAGVLAARAGNGVGGVGVAPDAELWALRACWQERPGESAGVCDSYTVSQALDLAIVEGARVINLSLTGERDALIERLVRTALDRRAVVVAAAEDDRPSFPASIPGVIGVHGWAGDRPRPAGAERLGAKDLVAPAIDILTTVPRGGFDFVSGSSFSAAQASGVAALLLERLPTLGPEEVSRLLLDSAAPADEADGPRLLDACAALDAALGGGQCSQ